MFAIVVSHHLERRDRLAVVRGERCVVGQMFKQRDDDVEELAELSSIRADAIEDLGLDLGGAGLSDIDVGGNLIAAHERGDRGHPLNDVA
jgi:hypothetical protein